MSPRPGEVWLSMSQYELALPRVPFLDRDSVTNVQGLGSIPTVRLERNLGQIPATGLAKLLETLAFSLEIP